MMQTTKTRLGDDAATWASTFLRRPVARRFFCQAEMRPVLVIIADVITHEAFQMLFVEYDHMIEQFAPTAADELFRRRESLVMAAADRASLIDYYKDDVRKLADLLGWDLISWLL